MMATWNSFSELQAEAAEASACQANFSYCILHAASRRAHLSAKPGMPDASTAIATSRFASWQRRERGDALVLLLLAPKAAGAAVLQRATEMPALPAPAAECLAPRARWEAVEYNI